MRVWAVCVRVCVCSGNKNGAHIFQFVMHFSATFVATTIMNNPALFLSDSLTLFVCVRTHT